MCKILWLFHYKKHNNYDHYLHVDFANYMKSIPGLEVWGYGLDLHLGYPDLCPMRYNPNILLEDIYKEFKFDAVVVNTKGRSFDYYNPHTEEDRGTWLPKDFSTWINTPRIITEEDYHYEKDDKWYHDLGFDVILQRHYSQYLRQQNVPMKFFPFSVDPTIFNTINPHTYHKNKILPLTPHDKRRRKIAFVGNDGDPAYIYRFKAIRQLVPKNMAVNYSSVEPGAIRRVDGEYIHILRDYIAHISCGSTFEICAAKNLEIMASGSVLFTNKFLGIDLLFPENTYVSYENDWSDLIPKAKKILNEPKYCEQIVLNAKNHINKYHTHNVRIKELMEIIEELK